MRVFLIAILILVFILKNLSKAVAKEAKYKQLNNRLSKIVKQEGYQLSGLQVLAVKDLETEYSGNFGYRYLDNNCKDNNLEVNEDTKFRIASISKLVSAIGIMQQYEKGKLDLNQDISKYLGFKLRNPNYPEHKITIKMLLSQTSSIRDGSFYAVPPKDSIKDFFLKNGKYYFAGEHWAGTQTNKSKRDKSPGKFFKYSNLNYGVLATILERVTGVRFDLYMRNNIFIPMDIDASYNLADFNKNSQNNIAVLYRKKLNGSWDSEGPWVAQVDDYKKETINKNRVMISNPASEESYKFVNLKDYKIGSNGTIFSPQGGLRISAKDLAKIMKMFLKKGKYNNIQILKEKTIDLMFKAYWNYDSKLKNGDNYRGLINSYGLGTHIIKNISGDRILADKDIFMKGHLGDAYGLLSAFMLDFSSNIGFIYLIGGVGHDPEDYKGEYSSFYRWEEEIMTAVFENIF